MNSYTRLGELIQVKRVLFYIFAVLFSFTLLTIVYISLGPKKVLAACDPSTCSGFAGYGDNWCNNGQVWNSTYEYRCIIDGESGESNCDIWPSAVGAELHDQCAMGVSCNPSCAPPS